MGQVDVFMQDVLLGPVVVNAATNHEVSLAPCQLVFEHLYEAFPSLRSVKGCIWKRLLERILERSWVRVCVPEPRATVS